MADTSQAVTRKLILLELVHLSALQRLDEYHKRRPERQSGGVVHFVTCPVHLDGLRQVQRPGVQVEHLET